jgi:CubicO group peptidase (beta-lactamase class C family)
MVRELFKPLGITSAGFGAPGKGSRGLLALLRGPDVTQPWGHIAGSGRSSLVEVRPDAEQSDNPPLYGPAGTVHLSLPDLARYVAFHATRGASVPNHLKPATIDLLHTPQFGGQYALGWNTCSAEESGVGSFALWHEGSNNAWDASLMVVPDDGRGLACVSNGCPESLQAGFGMDLVEIYNRWVGAKA